MTFSFKIVDLQLLETSTSLPILLRCLRPHPRYHSGVLELVLYPDEQFKREFNVELDLASFAEKPKNFKAKPLYL